MIPAEALARLAARASTIEERLAPPFAQAAATDARQIDARIARWAELGAKGDGERLRRSLRWRGIDLDRIRPALGEAALAPAAPLPDWAPRFAALLAAALGEHRADRDGPPPTSAHEAVMAPFARAAAASLRRALPASARGGVADTALRALEQNLLLRLMRIAGAVLAGEYHVYAYRDSRGGGAPETRTQRFAARLLQPPVPEFLTEYPVLARLLTLACDNWQMAAAELFDRLAADRRDIAGRFHQGHDPGPLVDIQIGDADVHDGHRQVIILVFDDGFRIVYKPRPLALDHAFHEFVRWLNERGLLPTLRSPAVLCRGGYGWAEFIAHRPADNAAERELFYRRAGVLACVAYVMGATDLHYGNVIAHGGYPIAIDLETLLTAVPRSDVLPTLPFAAPGAHPGGQRSVLQSLLLPVVHRVPTGVYTDTSALGAEPDELVAAPDRSWLPVHEAPLAQALRNHAAAVEAGFVAAYRFLERQREALLSESGPLVAFARCPTRIVLRDTALYFQILRHSIDPAVLRDGADRAIALERLNHVIAIAETPPSFVEMVTRERTALLGLDVPRFLVMTDETDLRDMAGVVAANVMERSPLAEMRLRIAAMGEADLQRQRTDIRLALGGRVAEWPGSPRSGLPAGAAAELPGAAMLVAAAERLATVLLAEAGSGGDTPPPWRGLVYVNAARRFTVGDAGAGFADGGLGIAALFAALFRVTGNPKWRDAALRLSLRYLAPMASTASSGNGHIAGGITAGLGGLLYGAALIAALADGGEVLADGLALAERLARRAVTEDRELSLGDGLAGTVLGIASLRQLVPGTGFDDACGRSAARLRAARPLPAAALLSGQAGLVLAAHAIGLEIDCSIPPAPWPEAATDWAEGTVGLALAALRADRNTGDALNFFESLAAAPMPVDDGFAFGAAGEADALLWAAERSGRAEFRRLALQRMAAAAERAYHGAPRLLGGNLGDGLRLPGLFHGSAGVAYVLLRLAMPDRLPALAAFELPAERKIA